MSVRSRYVRLLAFRASGRLIQDPKLSSVLMPAVQAPGMRLPAGRIRTTMDLVQSASDALEAAGPRVHAIALVECPNRRLASSPGPYGRHAHEATGYQVGYAIRGPKENVVSFTTCDTLAGVVRHVATFVRAQRFLVRPGDRPKRAPRRTNRPGRPRR